MYFARPGGLEPSKENLFGLKYCPIAISRSSWLVLPSVRTGLTCCQWSLLHIFSWGSLWDKLLIGSNYEDERSLFNFSMRPCHWSVRSFQPELKPFVTLCVFGQSTEEEILSKWKNSKSTLLFERLQERCHQRYASSCWEKARFRWWSIPF